MNLSSEPASNVEPQEVREDQGSSVPPIRFRVFPTVILASILVIFVGLLILVHFSTPKLEGVQRPELALETVANQMMYLRQGLAGTPEWEQTFNEVVGGTDQEIDQLIEWYAELTENSSDPLVHLYLSVLQVEGGYLESVKDKLSEWQNRSVPYPFFATLLGVAFFNEPVTGSDALELQARLAEVVPDSWFYHQLEGNIALRFPNSPRMSVNQEIWEARSARLVERNRVIGLTEVLLFIVGCLALMILVWQGWRKGKDAYCVGEARFPPPWPGWHGVTVLLRGGGWAALLLFLVSLIEVDQQIVFIFLTLFLQVPILLLAHWHLFSPYSLSLGRGTGCWVVPGGWGPLGLFVLAMFTLGLFGNWVITWGAAEWQSSIHWTDWYDPVLVMGSVGELVPAILGYAVIAPVLEEFVFRGILYATIRRQLGPWGSILISAGIFSLAHGYGVVGGLTIFWSGILWAWAYEKTGSLLPGMAAHAPQ